MDPVGTQCHYCLKSATLENSLKGVIVQLLLHFKSEIAHFCLIFTWYCDWHMRTLLTQRKWLIGWMGGKWAGSPPSSWPSFGELGADESGVAISSISEYMEPPLAPFLMLNAFPKELRNYREIERKAENLKHTEVIHNIQRNVCLYI